MFDLLKPIALLCLRRTTPVVRWLACALALLAAPAWASTYTFKSDVYAWESAANTIAAWDGTCTDFIGDDDQKTITFTGGFTFKFAGTNYSSVRVLANGMLQFGADTGLMRTYTNTALPAGTSGSYSPCANGATARAMMVYWADLDPAGGGGGGGTVTWEQKGSSPNRYVVVSWNSVYQYSTATPYTFQVILYESGEFKYQYGNANASGSNGTIGVQVDGSDYTQYSYNSGYNAAGSAIRWFIPSSDPVKLAEYRLDEFSWNGTVNEVMDATGNGHNGVRANANVSTTASGYVCRALTVPADTTTATNAVNTSLSMASLVGKAGSISMYVRSNVVWTNSTSAMIFDATTASGRPLYLMRSSGGALRFAVADSAGTISLALTPAQTFAANTWVHVAAVWSLRNGSNQSVARIYVNGVLAASTPSSTNGTIDPSLGTLYLGDNRSALTPNGGSVNSWNGQIDEVRVYNYEISAADVLADMAVTHDCILLDHVEALPSSTSASTCAPKAVTLRACMNSGCTQLVSNYTGTVTLSAGTGRGDWAAAASSPPNGTLANGTANDGAATYTFALADQGSANLSFAHSLSQDVTLTAVDLSLPSSARTSAAIQFRDNAFTFAEDLSSKVGGSDIAVAGRPHDFTLSLIKKDPSTGSCGVATDYTGSRALKFWRTDSGGSYTAPTVVSPALSIPSAQPAANNLTLSFTAGVASFNLGTTDVGRYSLNALDDALSLSATSVSGSSNALTVRPFVLLVDGIAYGATTNPNGSAATDGVFAPAGASFSATVSAYGWSSAMLTNGADASNTGTPAAAATAAALKAGGKLAGYNSATTLSAVAGSQTPATGVLGNLNNGAVAGASFSGGSATASTLQYTEVGSFQLNTTGVVSNYLGSGLALDAIVVNSAGSQNNRIGRFVPAKFALSGGSVTHRVAAACSTASSFSHLDEAFRLGYTLTAQNALGATTTNYTGPFARLDLATAANHNLAGIAGSTVFKTSGTARLGLGAATGTWANGVASGITLTATALRAASPDGPHAAQFGVAPVDLDGVAVGTLDLDTDSPANGNDRATVASVALRFGRLRLMNAMGSQTRGLNLPVANQYWNGTAFADNTLDSCTKLLATQLNYGNLRKTLTSADANMGSASVTLAAGRANVPLAAPGGSRGGTLDVAVSLGATATDASCLQTWTPAKAATTGAGMAYLRGAWCGSTHDKDPSARVTFGAFRGAEHLIYLRENH